MTLLLERPSRSRSRRHRHTIRALTRRRFITGTAVAASAAAVGGCGGDAEPAADPADREVATDNGPVSVPANPARVACADFYGAFVVVDLGLTPVGVSGSGYDGTGSASERALAGVPQVGDFTEPDLERVAATEPDLILRTIDTDDTLYEQLTRVAPTVVISFQRLSLPEVATRIGEVLGRHEQAEALLADYTARCQAVEDEHRDVLAATTFSVVSVASETTWWTLGLEWTDTRVLADCGVRLAEPSASQPDPTQEYSLEQLGVLTGSDVLVIPSGPDGVTPAPDNATMTSTALWKQLPPVQAGRVYAAPSGTSSLGSAMELIARLEEILGALAAG